MSVAALVLAAAIAGSPDRSATTARCAEVPVVAHRGVHSPLTTEDTTAAWARAVQKGANVVEGDARLSGSGTWVLMHDPTVNRTTHSRGRVGRMSDAELARVRYDDGRVGVSTLDAALAPVAASPATRLEIEVKPGGASSTSLRRFLTVLDAHGMLPRTTISSFHAAVLTRLHRLDPRWRTALITNHRPRHPWAVRRDGGTLVLGAGVVTAPTVRALHRAGVRVESWTVDSHATWRRVVRDGVDAVITDAVTRTRRWCARP